MDSIAIVGHYKNYTSIPTVNEIWTINDPSKYSGIVPDRHFDIHNLIKHSYWHGKYNELSNKLYILEQYKNLLPEANIFPFNDIIGTYGSCYFTSTIPWLLAYALMNSVSTIFLYGVEMKAQDERTYQKQCLMYWLGYLKANKVNIILPKECSLFKLSSIYINT